MASVVDAFNDALNENLSYVKFIVYAIPVYIITQFFMVGKTNHLIFGGTILGVLLLGVLTLGINNVRRNRNEILTLNPIKLIKPTLLALLVVVPQLLVYWFIGNALITNVTLPNNIPHFTQIYSIIIWAILFSLLFTSYLSFAKFLRIKQALNIKAISEACIDVLLHMIFFIPQLAIANVVLIGPVAYIFSLLNIPFSNWGFIAYCSIAFIVNISIMANYFAQLAFELIKGSNEEYDENVQITSVIDSTIEKIQ